MPEPIRARRRGRNPLQREDGQVIIMVGLATLVLFAVVGLTIDVGRMYIMKAQLSRAMDAAALAGVLELPNVNNAKSVCSAYLLANEPGVTTLPGQTDLCVSPGENLLEVKGKKKIETFFIRVIGVKEADVSAKARAGFGVANVDAVMVLDTTPSMAGSPLDNAKSAAIIFKNTLLGSTPDGRTVIGMTAFRGCYYPSPITNSSIGCVNTATGQALTSNSATLTTKINALTVDGGGANSSATNVCTGLAKGWSILDGPGNHVGQPNSHRYMILLSDGDNFYYGQNTYQGPLGVSAPSSPDGITVAGTGYPCQPYNSCSSPWNIATSTPCFVGTHTALANTALEDFPSSIISDNFPSACSDSNWSTGSGWAAAWVRSASNAPVHNNSGANDSSCHIRMAQVGSICRQVNLTSSASADITYYAKRGTTNAWESSGTIDHAYFEVSTTSCTAGFGTPLQDHTTSNTGTNYSSFTFNLDAYVGSNVYVRWRAATNASDEHFFLDTVSITSCSAWNGSWTRSPTTGADRPALVTSVVNATQDTDCHARIRNTASVCRSINLSTASAASITYHAKRPNPNTWESADHAYFEASTTSCTAGFGAALTDHTTSNTTTNYSSFTVSLDAYVGNTVYVRWRAATNATDEYFYLDAISYSTGSASADGYMNGQDGSNPATCVEPDGKSTPRERQLDVRTLNLARAIKAQGVEIYVVAFTAPSIPGCNLGSGVIYNDVDPSECNTVLDSPAGPIGGSPTAEGSANVRLLKCIASSTDETDDHYFYAASAGDLPSIFSQIAAKIAHRLID